MTPDLEIVHMGDEYLIDSRVLAAQLGYHHETVIRNITRHRTRLERTTVLRQLVGKPPKGTSGGRPEI